MKKLYRIQILLFLFSTNLFFGQDSVRFYRTIDTLCSSYFYGRGYENQGHTKTLAYLKTEFQMADDVEVQAFDFPLNHFQGNMKLSFDGKELKQCEEYIPLPQAKSGKGHAEIVFLDSVFFTNSQAIEKFIATKIKNKALVFHEKFEKIITSNKLLQQKIYSEPILIIKLTAGETLKSFSGEAWMPASFSVKESAFKGQKECCFELNQKIEKIESNNLIAKVLGTDTSLEKIIICAHYDHVGGFQDCFVPGANDNATGIAMLLELYHYFQQNRINRTIEFIAFGGEEVGLVGSEFYTQNKDLSKIYFLLNLDLIGAGSQGATVVNATVFKNKFQLLEEINKTNNFLVSIKQRGEAANSDHYYFTKKGISSFFIYSNGTVGGYHNAKDTPDKLEQGYFDNFFNLFKIFITQVADNH
jgi:aminopeptidase YwaD